MTKYYVKPIKEDKNSKIIEINSVSEKGALRVFKLIHKVKGEIVKLDKLKFI